MKSRMSFLDGLRGLAILLVLGYHAFVRWSNLVPFGDTYSNFPLFKHGWLGVELFFLISGFVIFMTLDRTKDFKLFIYKRWIRLFPAMIIASIIIYLTAPFFSERPAGIPNLLSLIPGLTFIEPYWWSKLLSVDINSLEGSFWSLYVEFKFYVVAGLIYFILGRKYLVPALFILFIGSLATSHLSEITDNRIIYLLNDLSWLLSLSYFGWFCSGALFYLWHQTKNELYFYAGTAVAILSSFFIEIPESIIGALVISIFFALSLRVKIIQRFLTLKLFMFFGFISYPFYLLHENFMVSIIIKLPAFFPWMNMFLYPLIPIVILSFVSLIIAKYFEKNVKISIEAIIQSLHKKVTQLINFKYTTQENVNEE